MRFPKILFLPVAVLFYVGCKKEITSSNLSATDPETETCTVVKGMQDGEVVEGQYIIEYKTSDNLRTASAGKILQTSREVLQKNGIAASAVRASFNGGVSGFVARLSSAEAQKLQSDAAIERVEPDRVVALSTCFTVVAPSLVTWNVTKVGYGNGTGKTAWIIDTGIDFDHPDLTVDSVRSRSFLSGNSSANDENGHGTHVAGIIGAKNNSFGVLGVASGATLISLRVLDKEGSGVVSSIIQALSYVAANGKAGDVVNMSLGEDSTSQILDNQVKAVAAKGIYVSIAAGNESKAANLTSPARVNGTNIYTVSAVDSLNNFASFSNFGNDVVDFAAPGVRIVSTYKDGKYARMSGTSMAAPHVAGLLLLVGNSIQSSGLAANDPDGVPDKIAAK